MDDDVVTNKNGGPKMVQVQYVKRVYFKRTRVTRSVSGYPGRSVVGRLTSDNSKVCSHNDENRDALAFGSDELLDRKDHFGSNPP